MGGGAWEHGLDLQNEKKKEWEQSDFLVGGSVMVEETILSGRQMSLIEGGKGLIFFYFYLGRRYRLMVMEELSKTQVVKEMSMMLVVEETNKLGRTRLDRGKMFFLVWFGSTLPTDGGEGDEHNANSGGGGDKKNLSRMGLESGKTIFLFWFGLTLPANDGGGDEHNAGGGGDKKNMGRAWLDGDKTISLFEFRSYLHILFCERLKAINFGHFGRRSIWSFDLSWYGQTY